MTSAGAPNDGAGSATGGPGLRRYLVGGDDPALLGAVAERLTADAAVRFVRALRAGSPGSGFVIQARPERAEALRSEYAGRIVVEPDSEIDPLVPVEPPTAVTVDPTTAVAQPPVDPRSGTTPEPADAGSTGQQRS